MFGLETFSNSATGVVLPSNIIRTMVAVRTINNTVKNVVVRSLDVSKSADERILTLSWKPVVSMLVNALASWRKGPKSWKRSKSWREVITLQMDHLGTQVMFFKSRCGIILEYRNEQA